MPTGADTEAFEKMKNTPPSAESHPHTFAWFILVQRFHESVRASWAAPAGKDKKGAEKKGEAKKAEADDELDLFGDDEPDEVSI